MSVDHRSPLNTKGNSADNPIDLLADLKGEQMLNAPASPLEILIVDDEEVIRSVVAETLSNEGHLIHTASSANDALLCLGKEKIDLVISDICMPRMDGLELTAMIRRLHPKVHVVLMSGYCPNTSRVASGELRLDGFISKPFQLATLVNAVRALPTGIAFAG